MKNSPISMSLSGSRYWAAPFLLVSLAILAAGCSRDPNARKQKFLQ